MPNESRLCVYKFQCLLKCSVSFLFLSPEVICGSRSQKLKRVCVNKFLFEYATSQSVPVCRVTQTYHQMELVTSGGSQTGWVGQNAVQEQRQHLDPNRLLSLSHIYTISILPFPLSSHSTSFNDYLNCCFFPPSFFYRLNLFMVDGCAWPPRELTLTILCRDPG